MSVFFFFFVSTETELTLGLPWVEHFSRSDRESIEVFVVGNDREALLGYARKQVESSQKVHRVSAISPDIESIVGLIRSNGYPNVVMIRDRHNDAFHEQLFVKSPASTIWIHPQGPPPESSNHVLSLDSTSHVQVADFCDSFLDLSLDLDLIDGQWNVTSESTDSNRQEMTDRVMAAERQRCDVADLVCIPIERPLIGSPRWKMAMKLMSEAHHASTLFFHDGHSVTDRLSRKAYGWVARLAEPMGREARKELSEALEEGARPNWEFLGLISASAMMAAFGLLQNSAAVIIGAMLIAPLMTPILGAGLSMTHGNRPLFVESIKSILLGFLGAIIAGCLFGLLVRFTQGVSSTSEMWARCNPTPLDFCVGLVGGMAASYARTRAHLSSALAGAAIAAALVPPLATAGLQIAFGHWQETDQGRPIVGPLLLVITNVMTIMIGSSIVLYLRGLRGEHRQSSSARWSLRMFVLLSTLACLILVVLTV